MGKFFKKPTNVFFQKKKVGKVIFPVLMNEELKEHTQRNSFDIKAVAKQRPTVGKLEKFTPDRAQLDAVQPVKIHNYLEYLIARLRYPKALSLSDIIPCLYSGNSELYVFVIIKDEDKAWMQTRRIHVKSGKGTTMNQNKTNMYHMFNRVTKTQREEVIRELKNPESKLCKELDKLKVFL